MGVLNMKGLRIFMLSFRYWFSLLPVLWGMYIYVETLSYVTSVAVILLVISSHNKTN